PAAESSRATRPARSTPAACWPSGWTARTCRAVAAVCGCASPRCSGGARPGLLPASREKTWQPAHPGQRAAGGGGMTNGPWDPGSQEPGSWDEFFSRFFGSGPARRPVHRVDISRLMSGQAREVVIDAARRAVETGSRDLDTDHLLWSALHRDQLRELL